jgi:septal ring factor EnvC (AmiA/AmiB activator)
LQKFGNLERICKRATVTRSKHNFSSIAYSFSKRPLRVLRIALVMRVQGSLASSTIGVAATLKRFEEAPENTETSSEDRKRFQAEISANKQELEALAAEQQQQQAAEMEAEEQLRTEQAKLSELEERVDLLEKALDNNPH